MLFFSPSTCLGRKTVLQCYIILAINSRKLCVTLTYPGKLLWGEDCQEVRAPWLVTVQLNASSVLKGFCVFWKGDRSYTEEKLFPLAVATLNWANLKSCRVCMCVYLLWQGTVMLQFAHSCIWNKTPLLSPQSHVLQFTFIVVLAVLQPGLILGHRLLVRQKAVVQYWYSGNTIVQRSIMDWGNN